MKTPILLAALLAVPLTAAAQDYDPRAVRLYYATEQARRDVCWNCEDKLAVINHFLVIMRNWNVYPPNFPEPGDIRVYDEWDAGRCEWVLNENGEEVWTCYNHTMRCKTAKAIDDLKSTQHAVNWYTVEMAFGAWYAGWMGQPGLAGGFVLTGIALQGWSTYLDYKIEQYENNKCANP